MNKTHTSAEISNLHNNHPLAAPVTATPRDGLPSAGTSPASMPPPPPNDLLALIPPALREIRFRSVSFAARLTMEQRALLFSWLANSDNSIEQIRQKVAAPAPAGFGLQAHATTLYRLRKLAENKKITVAVSDAFDTAQDLFNDERGASTAPLREALSLMLYARAVRAAKAGVESAELGRLVTTIARLERLNHPVRSAHKPSVSRRQVEPAALPSLVSPPRQTSRAESTPLPVPTDSRPAAKNDSAPLVASLKSAAPPKSPAKLRTEATASPGLAQPRAIEDSRPSDNPPFPVPPKTSVQTDNPASIHTLPSPESDAPQINARGLWPTVGRFEIAPSNALVNTRRQKPFGCLASPLRRNTPAPIAWP